MKRSLNYSWSSVVKKDMKYIGLLYITAYMYTYMYVHTYVCIIHIAMSIISLYLVYMCVGRPVSRYPTLSGI